MKKISKIFMFSKLYMHNNYKCQDWILWEMKREEGNACGGQ